MTWKDLMLILNQTLTSNEVRTALEAAKNFRDELFLTLCLLASYLTASETQSWEKQDLNQ